MKHNEINFNILWQLKLFHLFDDIRAKFWPYCARILVVFHLHLFIIVLILIEASMKVTSWRIPTQLYAYRYKCLYSALVRESSHNMIKFGSLDLEFVSCFTSELLLVYQLFNAYYFITIVLIPVYIQHTFLLHLLIIHEII